MKERTRSVLFVIALLIAFWLVWSRLRINVWVRLSGWSALLGLAGLAVVIFLLLDHLINRKS